jgi:protein TonB
MAALQSGNNSLHPVSNLLTVGTGLCLGGTEMFDKLIESNSVEAEFKPRRKFFMVSSVVVGILFVTAVVASLYAHDLDLGSNNFELAELIAPVANNAPEPEPPRQQPQQRTDQQTQNELPNRPELIARIDQVQDAPTAISTTRNEIPPIPAGAFTVDPSRPASEGSGVVGAGTQGTSSSDEPKVEDTPKAVEPPPAAPAPKPEPKKSITVSKGPVNGYATYLPKPPYPAVARQLNLSATVNVQVLINEQGDVVSAKAIDGHPLFKLEAERAAKGAKFKPTLLSDTPVKVTGIIVYRFVK